jgi:hypothetical protein
MTRLSDCAFRWQQFSFVVSKTFDKIRYRNSALVFSVYVFICKVTVSFSFGKTVNIFKIYMEFKIFNYLRFLFCVEKVYVSSDHFSCMLQLSVSQLVVGHWTSGLAVSKFLMSFITFYNYLLFSFLCAVSDYIFCVAALLHIILHGDSLHNQFLSFLSYADSKFMTV